MRKICKMILTMEGTMKIWAFKDMIKLLNQNELSMLPYLYIYETK